MKAQPSKKGDRSNRTSPLYTPPAAELIKRLIIQDLGRDLDGAYRADGRIDDPRAN